MNRLKFTTKRGTGNLLPDLETFALIGGGSVFRRGCG